MSEYIEDRIKNLEQRLNYAITQIHRLEKTQEERHTDQSTEEFVRVKHGHWKSDSRAKNDKSRIYQCSECGNYLDFHGVNAGRGDGNYCPNCGAKMDEVTE